VTSENDHRFPPTGRFSPLRYPGGKGKLAKFVKSIVQLNGLSDGLYVEPYAGGAAVAWELLLTGVVRRVVVNDLSRPIHAFWKSVLDDTDALCRLIEKTPVTLAHRDKAKRVFSKPDDHDDLKLGFATFFLNRTHRSGILNGSVIGGRDQSGEWKIDARFNKPELIERIRRIAAHRRRIKLFNVDAVSLLEGHSSEWGAKTLVYLDPPYFEKGGRLYYNSYRAGDHSDVAKAISALERHRWIVSYDDVSGYSARTQASGREAMYFSDGLKIPAAEVPMVEVSRKARVGGRVRWAT